MVLGAEHGSQSKGKTEDSSTWYTPEGGILSRREKGDETNPGDTVHQGNETHFPFRAINHSIHISTNLIKGLATLGMSASSLPSPDSNHFCAYIKLSNKKALLRTPFNILDFSRLPSHSYVLLLPSLQ